MRRQTETQAGFTYSMSGNVISIVDRDQGNRSVTNDVENVLRGIQWNGRSALFFPLRETDEGQAARK
jgi:hypothetical protein